MDNDEELRNDKLLDAIAVFREEQNEVTEHNFIQALIDAVFIAPVNFSEPPIVKDDGGVEIPDNAQMQLVTFELENGNGVFPVFTDLEAYNAQTIEADLPVYPWAMALSDYLPILQDDDTQNIEGLALNPFTNGMPITRDNIAYIAQQIAEQQQADEHDEAGDNEMEITSAEELIPTPLRYELIGIADDAMGTIESMYLLWLTNNDANTSNYLLVVDGPDRDAVQALYQQIATAFEEKAGDEGSAVDIVYASDFQVDLSEFDSLYNRTLG
ncbi:MAG TPA: SseB family protein [Weissella thailandensis]|uniref:SseB family protein n=1 Tax=Weissella thailandensis TaxID=89061 RepID=UPI001DFC3CA9|nr:SseB family protein [Weissella thailandensis]HJG85256.1 SseB family protein [Weissella thailandensis]